MKDLQVGDKIPAFSGETTDGRSVSASDFAGKYLVMYFYPKAFTPGCTKQTLRFRDNYEDIRNLGAEVLGVSIDEVKTQCSFSERHGVSFPLLADKEGAVSRAFGVRRRLLNVAKRVTYIINPDGVVVARFHHDFQVDKHLDNVLAFLRNASSTADAPATS